MVDSAPLASAHLEKLTCELAKFPEVATLNDHYLALAFAVRDRLLRRWVETARATLDGKRRTVIYLSAEFLIGPQLGANLMTLGLEDEARAAMAAHGLDLDELIDHEEEPGLGNGGLGRLAACYMDSLATVDIPAVGHGLRYEFGIFDQEIKDGWQLERTDRWLRAGNPWEVRRYDIDYRVGIGGKVEHHTVGDRLEVRWQPEHYVRGVPWDIPVAGYGTRNTNFLRLWSAVADEELDLDAFQVGDYYGAVDAKIRSENLTKILYPNDSTLEGKQLRLEQQYFLVSCTLQDCIRLLLMRGTIQEFPEVFTFQLNDTHPALAVAELMRLLVDVHQLGWSMAWDIVTRSMAYTNHTLLPEALETWALPLFAAILPRHLEIIYEINRRFLDEVRARFPGDEERVRRMSLIGEDGDKQIRMANLATVASHHVNGVAALHSRLLRETVLRDFAEMWPERFTNVTNGVTPRRFVRLANPKLSALITEAIGDGWVRDLDKLRDLEKFADDAAFHDKWRAVKRANKVALAAWLQNTGGHVVDPDSVFDAQCKRFHEYKRQHMNLLHIVALYDRLRRGEDDGLARTFIFAGKAAPAYRAAKLIIRLAHGIAQAIVREPKTADRLQIVFVPDFTVKVAQRLYPAADISEQISTAGLEASGTGNMKFALNGALTIGTLDGANIEIRDAVGEENFFLFGLTSDEVAARKASGYDPRASLVGDPELEQALALITSGEFSNGDRDLFLPLVHQLVTRDPFMVLADFRSYADCHAHAREGFKQEKRWTRMSIINVARCGMFSSDRAIREYATKIWKV